MLAGMPDRHGGRATRTDALKLRPDAPKSLLMGNLEWWCAGAAAVSSSALTWGACRWWFGRQLAAAAAQFERCDKARQFSVLQTMQARKQIEKMQTELAAQPRPPAEPPRPKARIQPPEAARHDALPVRLPLPAHGFADTERL